MCSCFLSNPVFVGHQRSTRVLQGARSPFSGGSAYVELEMYAVIGELDPALGTVDNTSIDKRGNIPMNGLYISIDAPRNFADRQSAPSGEGLDDRKA